MTTDEILKAASPRPWEWHRPWGSPVRYLNALGKSNTIAQECAEELPSDADSELILRSVNSFSTARSALQVLVGNRKVCDDVLAHQYRVGIDVIRGARRALAIMDKEAKPC